MMLSRCFRQQTRSFCSGVSIFLALFSVSVKAQSVITINPNSQIIIPVSYESKANIVEFSSDGKYVIYAYTVGYEDDDFGSVSRRIFSASMETGESAQLSIPTVSYSNDAFIFNNDQSVCYQANNLTYSVPIEGGASVISDCKKSPDQLYSTSPLYSSDAQKLARITFAGDSPDITYNLHVLDIASEQEILLTSGTVSFESFFSALMSPDGSTVVFRVQTSNSPPFTTNLFRVSTTGGEIYDYGQISGGFSISNDSSNVVFSNQDQIYSAPLIGGESILLSGLLSNNGERHITSDSSHVILVNYDASYDNSSVYSAPILGGETPTFLYDLGSYGSEGDYFIFYESNGYVLLKGAPNSPLEDRLISLPITGGEPIPLSMDKVAGDHYDNGFGQLAEFSSNGEFVFYKVSKGPTQGIYKTPISGGEPVKLTSSVIKADGYANLDISSDDQFLLAQAQFGSGDLLNTDVFAIPTDSRFATYRMKGASSQRKDIYISPYDNRIIAYSDKRSSNSSGPDLYISKLPTPFSELGGDDICFSVATKDRKLINLCL